MVTPVFLNLPFSNSEKIHSITVKASRLKFYKNMSEICIPYIKITETRQKMLEAEPALLISFEN